MRRTAVALVAGLVLVAIAIAVILSGSPLVVAHTNGVPANFLVGESKGENVACQSGESVPVGTSAIRFRLESDAGPRVSASVWSGGRLLSSGATPSGWTSGAVTVPITPLRRAVAGARVCFALGSSVETINVIGARTSAAVSARGGDGEALSGRFTVEYEQPAHGSWWSSAKVVARHLGLGREPAGTWIALLLVALMGGSVLGASWLLLRELP